MGTAARKVEDKQAEMDGAGPTDFVRLGELQAEPDELRAAKGEALEDEWLELATTPWASGSEIGEAGACPAAFCRAPLAVLEVEEARPRRRWREVSSATQAFHAHWR